MALRYDLAEMCVATEHFCIQYFVGEGELSFHKRQSQATTQYGLLVQLVYQLNHSVKVMYSDSHRNPACSRLSALHSQCTFSKMFFRMLNLMIHAKSTVRMRCANTKSTTVFHEVKKQNKDKVNGLAHYINSR